MLRSLFITSSCNSESRFQVIGTLPYDLAKIAAAHDCNAIQDYYSDSGIIDPPYVYGFASNNKFESAIFWCESEDSSKEYKLIFIEKNKFNSFSAYKSCDSILETNTIWGGLSLNYEKKKLSTFYYYPNFIQKIDSIELTKSPILTLDVEGERMELYCYDGRWIFNRYD